MIQGTISWYYAGPIITLNGRLTSSVYVDILGNQVHPMVQILFPSNGGIYRDHNSPIHTSSVQSLFEEHEDSLQRLPWPADSPDLNIIELWSIYKVV